jgi:hypothetical protein
VAALALGLGGPGRSDVVDAVAGAAVRSSYLGLLQDQAAVLAFAVLLDNWYRPFAGVTAAAEGGDLVGRGHAVGWGVALRGAVGYALAVAGGALEAFLKVGMGEVVLDGLGVTRGAELVLLLSA